jgi:hypothetical protein
MARAIALCCALRRGKKEKEKTKCEASRKRERVCLMINLMASRTSSSASSRNSIDRAFFAALRHETDRRADHTQTPRAQPSLARGGAARR